MKQSLRFLKFFSIKHHIIPLILVYSFFYIPVIYIAAVSFNDSPILGVWTHFSWRWYIDLFKNVELINAFLNSLKIAATTATLSVILGLCAAFSNLQGKNRFLSTALYLPLVMPEVVMGLALLLLFITSGTYIGWPAERGFLTVVIGHTTIATIYAYLILAARLRDTDQTLEEAGLDLGAHPIKVFLSITLPLIIPALFSGWMLAFVLSLDDVIFASFLSGPGSTTLPLVIFSSIRLGMSPEMSALSTLLILSISFLAFVMNVCFWRHQGLEKR